MARASINIRAGFDLDAFSKSSQKLARSMRRTAKKMQGIGKSMSTYLTAPIVGLGGLAVKEFATFEQSMAKVAAVSGATASELSKLTDLSRELGSSTRYTADQVADLQLNYAKLGFSTSEIEKITGATLNLALATGEDLARSAEVAGGTLRSFGMDASDMLSVTDIMAKSFSSSALDLEKFTVGMRSVGSLANSLGQSLEETTAQLSVLANNSVEASTAGTMMRNMMLKAKDEGFSMSEALAEIAGSSDKAGAALKFFDKRAVNTAIILANNIDKVNELTGSYENSEGAAKAMADVMDNTLQGSMFKLQSEVKDLAISFGETLAPFVKKVAEFAGDLAEKFKNLSPETKKTIVTIAGLAAAIGPLILAVGGLTAAFAVLAANPITFTIYAIAAAFVAVNVAVNNAAKILPSVTKAIDTLDVAYGELETQITEINRLKNLGNSASKEEIQATILATKATIKSTNALILQNIERTKQLVLQKEAAMEIAMLSASGAGGVRQMEFVDVELRKIRDLEKSITALKNKLRELQNQGGAAVDGLIDLQNELKTLGEVTENVNGKVGGLDDKLSKFTEKAIGGLKMKPIALNLTPNISRVGVIKFVDQATLMAQQAAANMKQEMASIGEDIADSLSAGLQGLTNQIGSMAGGFLGDSLTSKKMMKDELKNVEAHYDKLIEAAKRNGEEVTQLEQEKADKIASIQEDFSLNSRVQDFGRGLLDAIGGFMQEFGAAILSIGIAQSAIAKAIALGPIGAPLAIAGGIALIAAGTALSNLSKAGIGGEGSGGVSPSGGAGIGGNIIQPQEIILTSEINLSGRDMRIVQKRENSFRR